MKCQYIFISFPTRDCKPKWNESHNYCCKALWHNTNNPRSSTNTVIVIEINFILANIISFHFVSLLSTSAIFHSGVNPLLFTIILTKLRHKTFSNSITLMTKKWVFDATDFLCHKQKKNKKAKHTKMLTNKKYSNSYTYMPQTNGKSMTASIRPLITLIFLTLLSVLGVLIVLQTFQDVFLFLRLILIGNLST